MLMLWRMKNLYWTIKRLIQWIPVIWKDREYDQTYFLKIISFKLKLMEKFYRSEYAFSADWKDTATKIHLCKLLCDRLIADDYYEMFGREYKTDDFLSFELQKGGISQKGGILQKGSILQKGDISQKEGQLRIWSNWAEYEVYMQNQDLEYLCKIMQRHLFKWWD